MQSFSTPPRQRKLRNRDLELIEKSSIEYVQFKDESLPVYTWGNSDHPAIIMIPGWGGRPTDFGNWIEPLVSEGYRVVAPEGPAHGDSKANRTSLPELAEFLHSVVQGQENIAGYIGHSLGGAIILLGFSQGLVHKPSIFINTPADPEGIIDVFLEKIEGGKHIGRYIKEKVRSDFGKEFEEFSALHTARELSAVPVIIIHDRSDTESPIFHFEAFKEVVPWSEHLVTEYLGHNRILLDEDVVQKGTAFMADNA